MPRLLAFDTSGERFAAVLVAPGRTIGHEGPGGAQASESLIPALQGLLEAAGLAWRELDAIGFGQGPGAFTGLRTACAVAQGLAFGCGVPVLPLDTLAATAHDARARLGGPVVDELWVAHDARMEEIYAACYRIEASGRSTALVEPALHTLEALGHRWREAPPRCVAGHALAAFGARLPTAAARTLPEAWPSPEGLAAVARQAFERGQQLRPDAARPSYLRDKVALTTAERERVAAAGRAAAR